jgi:hypothetical protein
MYNLWVKKKSKREIRKYFELNEKENTISIFVDATKAVFEGMCTVLHIYNETEERSQINDLSRNKTANTITVHRIKELRGIRAEINETENKQKTIESILKSNAGSLRDS